MDIQANVTTLSVERIDPVPCLVKFALHLYAPAEMLPN